MSLRQTEWESFHTLLTWARAGPKTELPSQTGQEQEPDVAESELDRAGAYQAHAQQTWIRRVHLLFV